MKTLPMLATLLLTFTAAASDKTGTTDTANASPDELLGGTLSDLTPDSLFNGNGLALADFNDALSNTDIALRVFPASGGGYWLAGQHGSSSSSIQIGIAKLRDDGTLDTSYSVDGKATVATPFDTLEDVAKGIGDTLYFTGTYQQPGFPDKDFGVFCVDSDGGPCAGFGTNGLVAVSFDLGSAGFRNDFPNRIINAFSNLYVAGQCNTGTSTDNYAMCVTKLSAASGQVDTGFGTNGRFHRNMDLAANGNDGIRDIIAFSPAPLTVRLVIVGHMKRAVGADIDGFITSINGISGADETVFGAAGYRPVIIDLGTGKQDYLTRVIRRANGGYVAAGYAVDDSTTPTQYQLVLAGFTAAGGVDNAFGTNGVMHALVASGTNRPFDLVERTGSRDLVVGINILDDLFGDGHPMAALVQYDKNARLLRKLATIDAPAAAQRASHGNDLLLDGDDVVSAGFRLWNITINDYDMIATRHITTDSIFADTFGGASSD